MLFITCLSAIAIVTVCRREPSWFFLRDVGTTHRPAFAAFDSLGFASTDPYLSFGQPYRGNPNLLVFYPFPKSANSPEYFVLVHTVLLAAGGFLFLRRFATPSGSAAGTLVFALSGYVVSASSSLNAFAAIAWIPLVLHAAVSSERNKLYTWDLWRVFVLAIFSLSGEPVLIAPALALACLLAWRSAGRRGAVRLLVTGLAAFVATAPLHLETLRAALDSVRVVRGFGAGQALAYSLHPARLLETAIPGLFGSPSHLLAGGWWGYGISRGARPYVMSTVLGVVPVLLVAAFGLTTRFRSHRGWWILLGLTLFVAFGGYLPGSAAMWTALPFLHVVRFPVKAFLFTTLATAVLTAFAFDYFSQLPSSSTERRRVAAFFGLAAFLSAAGGVIAAMQPDRIERSLVRLWWNPAWNSDAHAVLAPIVAGIPGRLFAIGGLTTLTFFWLARRRGTAAGAIVIAAVVIDLAVAALPLLPMVKARAVSERSPLLEAAQKLNGRIFERAGKDLDPITFGLLGRYPTDDARHLAIAQSRQAWATYGAMSGLRYAYDRCPDGSYTWRNQLVQDRLEGAPWEERVKWLRGNAVAGVIASNVPPGLPGLVRISEENRIGIPAVLYAVEPRLAELRRPQKIRWVNTPEEALQAYTSPEFDERSEIVVEGQPSGPPQEPAGVRMLRDDADQVVFASDAGSDGLVFLTRSYSRRVRATSGGRELVVYPANVHLCAIKVPAGKHRVVVSF